MAKIRPLDNRVVVQLKPAEETSSGGIIIPDTAKEKPRAGTVIAVGSGHFLREGDQILLTGDAEGTEIILDGETYLVLKESDILAVLE
jgi:chaperonin GroES